jgi:hypothetical protein
MTDGRGIGNKKRFNAEDAEGAEFAEEEAEKNPIGVNGVPRRLT